ncbi:ester cyclase [Pectobacterium carotovorum]
MSIQKNKEIFNTFVDFINTSDSTLASEIISDAVVFYVPGQVEPLSGIKGYMQILNMMKGGFPDIQWSIEEIVVEENAIAARFLMTGTHQGPFWGVQPTGIKINAKASNFYKIKDGKIVEEYGQPDIFSILQQLGVVKI